MSIRAGKQWTTLAASLCVVLVAACGEDAITSGLDPGLTDDGYCSIPEREILSGGPGKDGIPALTNPSMVSPDDLYASYLRDSDRVIGIVLDAGPVAIPLNILWWHEIVNLEADGRAIAVTHCPLTGSSLAFDRGPLGDAEFGVSGLLFRNNLMMYNRSSPESLWPQLSRGARCGDLDGTPLDMVPIIETTWASWVGLHPDTRVVSSQTGHSRNYRVYPYGDYDQLDNAQTLYPVDVDPRRPAKERVLGIADPLREAAYPFGELARLGTVGVASHNADVAIFWDGASETAMAYRTGLEDGRTLTFLVESDRILDTQTGSVWGIDGVATEGPLQGEALSAVPEAYVVYWFAWAAFERGAHLWSAR